MIDMAPNDVSDTDSYADSDSSSDNCFDSNIADDENDSMSSENEEHELDQVDNDAVYVDILRASASQQLCVICNEKRHLKKKIQSHF